MVSGISGSGYDVTSIWQNLFNKIDTNGDGTIDKTEMGAIVSKNGPSMEDIFSKLDMNQDGVISKNEYEEVLSKLCAQRPPPPPSQDNLMGLRNEEMFNKIDTNGDGSISKDELASFMGQSASSSAVDKMFKEVDTNNDGVISQAESDDHLKKMQEKMNGETSPDSAAGNASNEQDWMTKMIEKLLTAYTAGSNGSSTFISSYA